MCVLFDFRGVGVDSMYVESLYLCVSVWKGVCMWVCVCVCCILYDFAKKKFFVLYVESPGIVLESPGNADPNAEDRVALRWVSPELFKV